MKLHDKIIRERHRNGITQEELAERSNPEVYDIRSWYGPMKAYSYPSEAEMTIASQTLLIGRTTYMEGANQQMAAQLKRAGIEGVLGNKLFLGFRLWIDTKNQRFAVTQ